ncbi:hypothetical protein IQ37_04120 [Chryseobacterium piperi]|uniref:HTTM domain-containing protein n=1 Tax=Chryseobacterium piperi TaxID=558152 RepID=A0A086BL00_9FLAO|nr:hypothetical protein [Chryseobacterium piperi]ASW74572.1 hypothetical protein CJF12_09940 [Chryseobacterium piperi]KFF29614.1 hypothetical protein IQ37_04120 [Chryseobacterium piperi]
MKYPQLTVFNYKVAYYILRLFGLYWLVAQYLTFIKLKERPATIYEPVFWMEKLIFPEFPSTFVFAGFLVACASLLIITIFKPSYILNVFIFLLVAIINLPISANFGVHHDGHIIILGFFLTIFLLPRKLEDKDYKLVQYFYLGILMTYTLAGMSKILGTIKNVVKHTDKLTWLDKNAAKLNTYDNYWMADMAIPESFKNIYAYENFWVVITVLGILTQFFCFLGAFNRKLLTFFLIFLYIFHAYTTMFVLADFENANYFLIVIFFPYHLLRPLFMTKGR